MSDEPFFIQKPPCGGRLQGGDIEVKMLKQDYLALNAHHVASLHEPVPGAA